MPACTPLGVKSSSRVASSSGAPPSPPPAHAPSARAAASSRLARVRRIVRERYIRADPSPPAEERSVESARSGARAPRRAPRERAADSPFDPLSAYLAELIGTFALVLFICLVIVVNSTDGLGSTDFVAIALVHFFVLMMLIHSL